MIKLLAAASIVSTLLLPQSVQQKECNLGLSPEIGQVACCCYDGWGNQCCAWVYVCPGPVPGCPCVY